ncbi:hypothetical protein VM98_37005, partial [Streptomyces rubellomurinus subsp. indigoferus]
MHRDAGAAGRVVLDGELDRRLAGYAREGGCALFKALRAGLAVLIAPLGGVTHSPIRTAVAGRADEALVWLVGFFVNTRVLRTYLSGDAGFTEVLARVREADLAAYEHQD